MSSLHEPHDPRIRLAALRGAAIRRAEHDPEGHTIAWERQQVAALVEESKIALAEIDAAERRLENGLYGMCTTCGREISAERLDALPATASCVNCAR